MYTLERWPYGAVEPQPGEHEAYSQAVSLKRIADSLEVLALASIVPVELDGLAEGAAQVLRVAMARAGAPFGGIVRSANR